GTDPGQVLAPVVQMVKHARESVTERLRAVQQVLDPSNKRSELTRALDELRSMLEPTRKGSIQDALRHSLDTLTREDGELGTFVERRVSAAIKPLAQQIERLGREVLEDKAAEEALATTAAKGRPYEVEVTELLRDELSYSGVAVEHVGD